MSQSLSCTNFAKRLLDLILVIPAIFLLAPVLVLIGILVYINFGSPVFFTQQRPGLSGKAFRLLKFRTLRNLYDSEGQLIPDEKRITPFGKFLRSISLDELPELINVLKGEMSLVGPRPLLMKYLRLYTPKQAQRHLVKPGISGWAQVNGRNTITWEQKFDFDIWYVHNLSLWLDLKIIVITLWKIIRREGISQQGQATTEEFKGSQQ